MGVKPIPQVSIDQLHPLKRRTMVTDSKIDESGVIKNLSVSYEE